MYNSMSWKPPTCYTLWLCSRYLFILVIVSTVQLVRRSSQKAPSNRNPASGKITTGEKIPQNGLDKKRTGAEANTGGKNKMVCTVK